MKVPMVLWLSRECGSRLSSNAIEQLINRRAAPSAGIAVSRGTAGPSLTSIS